MSRVVVVGAGVGGLAAAVRLAARGHTVTVCDRADTVGGKLGTYDRDGFRFDTGPSILTIPDTLGDLFTTTGEPLDAVLPLRRLDPVARYGFADGTSLDLPGSGDVAATAQALEDALGAPAGAEWRAFMAEAARLWELTRGPFLESPLNGPAAMLRLLANRPGDLFAVAPWRTLRDVARRAFTDPRLRLLIERYATYSGSDPRRAPAALAVVPYIEQTAGGWYVEGGLRRIADALLDRALALGVEVRLGAEVTRIGTAGESVDGVGLATGERLPADVVVSDVDAAVLYDRLLPRPRMVRRLSRATPSLSGFVLLLGVRGRTPDLAHHTVLFPSDYDAEFDAVFGTGGDHSTRPVPEPTLYVSAPRDPTLAPPGDEAWFVLVNAPRHGDADDRGCLDWDAPGVSADYAARLLDLLAARGLDVRDRLAFAEHRSPADLERATGAPGGSIYGTSSNGARAAFLRPANRSPVRGLFLVGGSAHPGGGLPLVCLSAAIVDGLVGPA